jgi:phosphate transport system substrate-binding protein
MNKLSDRESFRTLLRSARPGAVFVLLALALCSCSEKKDSPSIGSNSATGKLVIKGSNTIGEELGPRLVAEYKKDHPSADIAIESKATGYGFAALLAGQCDLAAASRPPIKDELELAQSRGFEFKDYPIGAYTVAVIVNGNSAVKDLTREQVRDVFTGVVQNWKDLGGPDSPIHLYIRDPISGTYLGFRELAMENKPYGPGMKTYTNYLGIAEAVAQDPAGIGYTGLDLTTQAGINAISIGGIAPTPAAVNEGKYPYARKLQFYTHKGNEGQKAVEFVQFVQSPKGQEIVKQMGYVPRP